MIILAILFLLAIGFLALVFFGGILMAAIIQVMRRAGK